MTIPPLEVRCFTSHWNLRPLSRNWANQRLTSRFKYPAHDVLDSQRQQHLNHKGCAVRESNRPLRRSKVDLNQVADFQRFANHPKCKTGDSICRCQSSFCVSAFAARSLEFWVSSMTSATTYSVAGKNDSSGKTPITGSHVAMDLLAHCKLMPF